MANLKALPGGKASPKKKVVRSKLRKVKSQLERHIEASIAKAAALMNSPTSTEATQLKASIFLINTYIELHGDIIEEELLLSNPDTKGEVDEAEEEGVETPAPSRLLLTVQNKEE